MDNVLVYWLILYLLVTCIFVWARHKSLTHPILIFNAVWLLLLGAYVLHFSELQQPLSMETSAILWLAVIGYDLGVFVFLAAKHYRPRKAKKGVEVVPLSQPTPCLAIRCNPKEIQWRSTNIRLAADVILVVLLIVEGVYSGGYPLIWKLIGVQKTYMDFGIPSLNGAIYGAVIMFGALALIERGPRKYLYIVIGLLIVSRQIIISIILEAIILKLATLRKKPKKSFWLWAIAGGFALLLAFAAVGNFRSGSNTMQRFFFPSQGYEWVPDWIRWPYAYLCFSLSNFNNLVSMAPAGVNKGATILLELTPTVIARAANIQLAWNENYLVFINFNVSTYLSVLYLDFGGMGIFIFNLVIGLLGAVFYINYSMAKSNRAAFFYAVHTHNVVLLFFVNMFFYLPVISQFVYALILLSKTRRRRNWLLGWQQTKSKDLSRVSYINLKEAK